MLKEIRLSIGQEALRVTGSHSPGPGALGAWNVTGLLVPVQPGEISNHSLLRNLGERRGAHEYLCLE